MTPKENISNLLSEYAREGDDAACLSYVVQG